MTVLFGAQASGFSRGESAAFLSGSDSLGEKSPVAVVSGVLFGPVPPPHQSG
jgi:hypothetical protein